MNKKIITIIGQLLAFIWLLGGGIYVGMTRNIPIPNSITPTPSIGRPDYSFQKEYDIVAKSNSLPPEIIFIEAVDRNNSIFGQAYYFDGNKWQSVNLSENQLSVTEPEILNQMTNAIHSQFQINQDKFELNIPEIQTTMVIRSDEQFSKFGGSISDFQPYLVKNGNPIDVQIGFLKGLNTYTGSVDVYKLGITTDWLMYWDNQGNFVHLDKTSTQIADDYYPPHEFFGTITLNPTFSGMVHYLQSVTVERNIGSITLIHNSQPYLNLELKEAFHRPYWQDISQAYLVTDNRGGYGLYLSFTPKN